jgi:CRISPR-associated endonuclease Csn1
MRILGLDIGTNSVGWALVDYAEKKILGTGVRVIPMSQDVLGDFGKGNSVSQTAERTHYRSIRRLRERHLLRRERLHRVLNILRFLPDHYASQIDFDKRPGKFLPETEPKLAYRLCPSGTGERLTYEFLFKRSFEEMLADFRTHQPQILVDEDGKEKLVPYDWTIYYLRKKALTQKVEKEELAWILLNFNQKRGYYQLRGEEEEDRPDKREEYYSLRIVDVLEDESQKKGKGSTWYSLILENGWVYRRPSKTPLYDWKGKVRDFIVTTELNPDGTVKRDREGNEKRSFRSPGEDDWKVIKKKTEQEVLLSGKTVGAYIYDTLLRKPNQKIRGQLIRTIERRFYKEELRQILRRQQDFHPELRSAELYNRCLEDLYRNNSAHRKELSSKDFVHLFLEDILYYQRPLRSQKALVGRCKFEYRRFIDENKMPQTEYLKSVPVSNPFYQEFRIWQWLHNLTVYRKEDDADVTAEFLMSQEDREDLFNFLNSRGSIRQHELIKYLLARTKPNGKISKAEIEKYRWNYVEEKEYPCNETRYLIATRLSKVKGISNDFLDKHTEYLLWHMLYSIRDKVEFEKALKTFAKKRHIDEESFVDAFKNSPPFVGKYGAYSEKAIKKLLPLMRLGSRWQWEQIDGRSRSRIEKIITGEYDESIGVRVRQKAMHLSQPGDFQGLPLWLAEYVVYGRHSEAEVAGKWNSVDDLNRYLSEFKQHSLRNPIVEQIVTESLRVVRQIWIEFGNGAKNFFDEIHVELGREMKNPSDRRKRITDQILENENTNLRLRALLFELYQDGATENVHPYSPAQLELLKVYEQGVLDSETNIEDDILRISKSGNPSSSDLKRYKLWLEQRYRSPYTGKVIPLNKLFTAEYEVEHIIPQSRYFDDSLTNKVICESAINSLKDNQLAYEFIKNHQGQKVQCGSATATVFTLEEYEDFVKRHYARNRAKKEKLLMEDIPDAMINRQMNDTRYISRFVSAVLSNIVRSDSNDDGVNSKNVVQVTGAITNRLKQDWGLTDIWNELILPRFERMNAITKSSAFMAWSEKYQKFLPTVPLEFAKGYSKKRIDHRHHALDALIIACATRDHVNLLNNIHAKSNVRFDLNRKLRRFEKVTYVHPATGERVTKDVPREFLKPWPSFTVDARSAIESIIVSFKQNLRVINKATNRYEKWGELDGKKKKQYYEQEGVNWAIRKPLHKDTVAGKVELKRVRVPSGKVLTASRRRIDTTFDLATIESITDTGIQKILRNYLASKGGNPEIAFSPEGLEDMNTDIKRYNDGKDHKPIYSVRVFEIGSKFPLGQIGNKKSKYVEAAKGTNLFFAVYERPDGSRKFSTIPLNIVIERQKQGLSSVPIEDEKGNRLLFYLSPNDLVYVPSPEERLSGTRIDFGSLSKEQIANIYKVVSFTGNQVFFVRHEVASAIVNKMEFSTLNKMERAWDGTMIKEYCIKLNVDILGRVTNAGITSN